MSEPRPLRRGGAPPEGLLSEFERRYGAAATHLARAPGRVNLIGEHIDYCGLSVLPMALHRSVWMAFRPNGLGRVRIRTSGDRFEPREFDAEPPIESGPPGDWGNYARAAVEAVRGAGWDPTRGGSSGFDALVATDLPIASGLSSSSALVIATALAVLEVGGHRDVLAAEPLRLADVLARGERYAGTAGGGMDQAACLLGRAGCAIRVDFDPLAVTALPLPTDWTFICAHSGQRAEKSGAAREAYNLRTREAREAVRAAWTAAGEPERLETAGDGGLRSYRALLERPRLTARLRDRVPSELRPRFDHITREAARVRAAERAVRSGDLDAFGAVLLESHRSLRDDYEVSTPRLDELVRAAVEAGAVGARLTGAGFGGCMVAVCEASRSGDVFRALSDRGEAGVAFYARPGDGADVHPA